MSYATNDQPFIVRGQLTLRTIRGRNGPFNVSRLVTHRGDFVIKDRELEQYPEGKYEGEFSIRYIFPKVYPVAGGMRFEIRANLDGMTLFGVEKLKKEEARQFHTQDVDPLDEELSPTAVSGSPDNVSSSDQTPPTSSAAANVAPSSAPSVEPAPSANPLIDTTPFGARKPASRSASSPAEADAALFGTLWPLEATFKLDATVDRRVLRQQLERLPHLGYRFLPLSQEWSLISA